MNYLDQFLIEVQSLKIAETTFYVKDNVIYDLDEINPELHPDLPLPFEKRKFLDLRHYDQFRSNHEAELIKLQQLALNEILNLNPAQIQLHLKRIEQILQRFDRLHKVFKDEKLYEYFNKSGYPTIDLELKVLYLFQYDKFDTSLSHSIWFFADLQDALTFKEGILEGFVSQIKKVLEIEPEQEQEHEPKKEGNGIVLSLNDKIYRLDFDYSPVPEKIRFSAIHSFFGGTSPFRKTTTDEYLKWYEKLKQFYFTIDESLVLPVLKKGIEYATLLLKFHKEHECKSEYCNVCESWERRLVLANKYLKELEPANLSKVDKSRLVKSNETYNAFKDIFAVKDWRKYIVVLEKTTPALLSNKWEFKGNAKGHKGVICEWIRELQFDGIIKQSVNRPQLASVLNNEIKGLGLGKDGRSLNNPSTTYKRKFKNQIQTLLK